MLASAGELVFFTDADLSTPLYEIYRALAVFGSDRDLHIIVGNRQHPDSEIIRHQSWMRERMGKTFNALVRWLAGIEIRDTQCGFKGFRQVASRAIFERQKTDGFSFDGEVLLLAKALGFGVKEIPVHWSNSPDSNVPVVSDSLKMLRDVADLRPPEQTDRATPPYHSALTAQLQGALSELS